MLSRAKRHVGAILLVVLAGLWFASCNTARGVGMDLQEGGKAIQNAAENAKK